jgi:ubiquinone/menaquinone biosynthesis C-methylase UbiE
VAVIGQARGDLAFARTVYDWWGRHPGAYRAMIAGVTFGRSRRLRRRAVSALKLEEGGVALDLGCGIGPNLGMLEAEIGPSGRIIAVDYSDETLTEAEQRATVAGWENIEFLHGDAATIELAPGSVDAALASLSLSAIPDAEGAIATVRRALRPAGRFVVLDLQPFEGLARVINPLTKPVFGYATNWHHERDLIADLQRHFDAVDVEWFNGRSVFIACCGGRVKSTSELQTGTTRG